MADTARDKEMSRETMTLSVDLWHDYIKSMRPLLRVIIFFVLDFYSKVFFAPSYP